MPHGVEAGLGIHDAPVLDDDIELLALRDDQRHRTGKEDQDSAHGDISRAGSILSETPSVIQVLLAAPAYHRSSLESRAPTAGGANAAEWRPDRGITIRNNRELWG
jgi:hypothetical protein